MEEMLYVFPFAFFLLFTAAYLVAASISHFLTVAIRFSCFPFNEIMLVSVRSENLGLQLTWDETCLIIIFDY